MSAFQEERKKVPDFVYTGLQVQRKPLSKDAGEYRQTEVQEAIFPEAADNRACIC
jgi:hypothetical protein